MDTNESIAKGRKNDEKMSALPVGAGDPEMDAKGDEKRHHLLFRICAVVGVLCAVAGWLLFYFEPVTAVAVGCAGACASVCGIWSGRGCLRSLAITGLVASAVLELLYFAFYWGLPWGVSHL